MATNYTKRGFVGGDQSADNLRKRFIETPLEGAKESVLNSGFNLLNLMSLLPDAFIASQRRELERVKESGQDNDLRAALLEASIDQATELRNTIQRGESRLQRAIGSVADKDDAFHGFISDSEFEPLKGLTVRLRGTAKTRGSKALTATTDDDGYFRIPLGSKTDSGKESRTKVAQMNLSERISSMFAQPAAAASTGPAEDASSASKDLAQVEILRKTKVVHTDPVGVPTDEGSVYREYVVAAEKSLSDVTEFADSTTESKIDVGETVSTKKATKKRDAGRSTGRASKK